jgi:hypothetical protein
VTCSNLTDLSTYPNNTNVDFTNVFDNQIDFARVDYLALESITFTTAPPPPPMVVALKFMQGGLPVDFIESSLTSTQTNVGFLANDLVRFDSGFIAEGDMNLNVRFNASSLPNETGRVLATTADVNNLSNELTDWLSDPDTIDNLPLVITDNGSFGTVVQLVNAAQPLTQDLSGYLDNSTHDLFDLSASPSYDSTMTTDTGPGCLTIQPVMTWDAFTMFTAAGKPSTYRVIANTTWGIFGVPSVINMQFDVVAVMDTGPPINLGTYNWHLTWHMADLPSQVANGFPPASILNLLPLPTAATGSLRFPYLWFDHFPLSTTGHADSIFASTGVMLPTLPPPDGTKSVFAWTKPRYDLEFQLIGKAKALADPALPLVKTSGRHLKASKRYYAPLQRSTPYAMPRAVAAIPTYDNLIQLICSELDVDRTAGSNSSQLLAIIPFDYTKLASGFYQINVPVNSLVWRRLADIHIRSLTLGLFNGIGNPFPPLVGQDFVVTLQLRYI